MDRLLLDTCVFLWWQAEDSRLSADVRKAIQDAQVVFVSAASSFEIAVKISIGKLSIPQPVSAALADHAFRELPISIAHTELVRTLPLHHKDPFDRLLVAQAGAEALVFVTADEKIRPYNIETLWV